jgi:hypothetical protein
LIDHFAEAKAIKMEQQPLNASEAKPLAPTQPPLHKSDADDDDENVKQLDECSSLYLLMQVVGQPTSFSSSSSSHNPKPLNFLIH